ncbi:MAG: hypothetical protein ABL921_16590 [Pirellula sp.]
MNRFGYLAFLIAGLFHCLIQDREPITPEDAIKSMGKPEIVVELTVRGAKNRLEKRGLIYLDSEVNFADPKNLGIALSARVAEQLKSKGIEKPEEFFVDRKIKVTGTIMRFEERPYLPVLDISQLKFEGDESKAIFNGENSNGEKQ